MRSEWTCFDDLTIRSIVLYTELVVTRRESSYGSEPVGFVKLQTSISISVDSLQQHDTKVTRMFVESYGSGLETRNWFV